MATRSAIGPTVVGRQHEDGSDAIAMASHHPSADCDGNNDILNSCYVRQGLEKMRTDLRVVLTDLTGEMRSTIVAEVKAQMMAELLAWQQEVQLSCKTMIKDAKVEIVNEVLCSLGAVVYQPREKEDEREKCIGATEAKQTRMDNDAVGSEQREGLHSSVLKVERCDSGLTQVEDVCDSRSGDDTPEHLSSFVTSATSFPIGMVPKSTPLLSSLLSAGRSGAFPETSQAEGILTELQQSGSRDTLYEECDVNKGNVVAPVATEEVRLHTPRATPRALPMSFGEGFDGMSADMSRRELRPSVSRDAFSDVPVICASPARMHRQVSNTARTSHMVLPLQSGQAQRTISSPCQISNRNVLLRQGSNLVHAPLLLRGTDVRSVGISKGQSSGLTRVTSLPQRISMFADRPGQNGAPGPNKSHEQDEGELRSV